MFRVSCFAVRCFSGVLVVSGLFFDAAPSAAQLRTVALTGQQVPHATLGTTFRSFKLAGINDLGQTAMIAETNAGQSIMVEDHGTFRTVAGQGDVAPDDPAGATFSEFMFAVLNDVGQVAFVGGTLGNSGYSVWSEAGVALHAVALIEDTMPGASGPIAGSAVFREISIPALNAGGDAAIVGRNLNCSGIFDTCVEGAFHERNGVLNKLAITGDDAPELADDFYTFPMFFDPIGSDVAVALSDSGYAAFVAEAGDNDVLWLARGGTLKPVIVSGATAPGVSGGPVFDGAPFGAVPAINNTGQVAVAWQLEVDGDVTASNSQGIWTSDGASLRLVARQGDPAPGASASFSYLSNPLINTDGDIAFVALIGAEGEGIWVERAGNLQLVVRSNQPAPDTPGAVFATVSSEPIINAAGQIAFMARLKPGDGSVTEMNDLGLWAQDSSGALRLIAREGDEVDVDNGPGVDLRVFSDLSILSSIIFLGHGSGNEDGRPTYFNDRGQLAFWASFTDGSSGVFVSNAVAVPEGSGFLLASCAAYVTLIYWRRAKPKGDMPRGKR